MDILFTRGDPAQGSVEFVAIVVDATVTETHTKAAEITEHFVGTGANLADHYRLSPDRLSAEVVISNTPIISPGVDSANGSVTPTRIIPGVGPYGQMDEGARVDSNGNAVAAKWSAFGTSASANILTFAKPFDRVQAVYTQLEKLMQEAQPVTLITKLKQYDNMLLIGMSAPRDAGFSDAIKLTLDFAGARFADSQIINEPAPLEVRGSRTQANGRVDPAPTTEETEEQPKQSWAKALTKDGPQNIVRNGRRMLGLQ